MLTAQLGLGELVRIGLVGRYEILAGGAGLTRPVGWVNAVAGARSEEYQPAAAEFVILMPPYGDLDAPLIRLIQTHAAGVAINCDTLSADVTSAAEHAQFPILQVDASADLAQMQRDLLRLLVDKEAGVLAHKAEIYQRLTRLSVENQGLDALVRAIADLTHNGVLVQDKRLQVLASAPPRRKWSGWDEAVEWSTTVANLPLEFQDRRRAGKVREPLEQPLQNGARLITPINVREIARGFLSIVSPTGRFDTLDQIALEQGAAACAVEMAKAKAVSEVRKKLTGDLIEALLTHSISETDAARWADRAGYRRAGPHVALTLQWIRRDAPSLRRLETIISGELKRIPARGVAELREDEIVVLYAVHPEQGLPDAMQWAQKVHDLARAEFPHARLALGIGRPSETLLGLRQSYHEALQAMKLEHQLQQDRPQYYGELGVYRLLLQLLDSPELRSFVEQVLGGLVEYDRTKGTNLVETLSVYFQHNANLAQTAQALYVHRNTLLYRLQRAAEIGQFDLDNPETRLAIQLALRAHALARQEGEFLPPL